MIVAVLTPERQGRLCTGQRISKGWSVPSGRASPERAFSKQERFEARLYAGTWLRDDYDLLPRIGMLEIPTLVIRGDHEFIPEACTEHIAGAIPKARSVTLKQCGHFSYLECAEQVRRAVDELFQGRSTATSSR